MHSNLGQAVIRLQMYMCICVGVLLVPGLQGASLVPSMRQLPAGLAFPGFLHELRRRYNKKQKTD
jgi:hypothetical protein